MNHCHLLQYGWNWKALCLMKPSTKRQYCTVLSLVHKGKVALLGVEYRTVGTRTWLVGLGRHLEGIITSKTSSSSS